MDKILSNLNILNIIEVSIWTAKSNVIFLILSNQNSISLRTNTKDVSWNGMLNWCNLNRTAIGQKKFN